MVSREIIETIIYKSVELSTIKCGQRLTISNKAVRKVLNDFAHSTRNRKTEKGLLITADGEIAFNKNGNKHSVPFTEDEVKDTYEKYGELHVEHNHPDIVKNVHLPYTECLSDADMDFLLHQTRFYDQHEGWGEYEYCFKSITAEGTNGSRMTLVRGDNYSSDDDGNFYKAQANLNKSYREYQELYSKTRSKVLNEIVPPGEYNLEWSAKIHKEVINRIGDFEDTSEFKDIQKGFRSANCKLTVEWIEV